MKTSARKPVLRLRPSTLTPTLLETFATLRYRIGLAVRAMARFIIRLWRRYIKLESHPCTGEGNGRHLALTGRGLHVRSHSSSINQLTMADVCPCCGGTHYSSLLIEFKDSVRVKHCRTCGWVWKTQEIVLTNGDFTA